MSALRQSASAIVEDVEQQIVTGQMMFGFGRSASSASMLSTSVQTYQGTSVSAGGSEIEGKDHKGGIRWYMWPILCSIDSMGPLSTDTTTPSLPIIAENFQVTEPVATASYALNILGTAVGSIFIGILADRYGRKRVLMAALSLYIVTLLLASFSSGIAMFTCARLVMGVMQGCQVLAPVFARDLIDDTAERMRAMAILGGLNAFAIVAAPSIGGLVSQVLGWRWMFAILAIWASCTLLHMRS